MNLHTKGFPRHQKSLKKEEGSDERLGFHGQDFLQVEAGGNKQTLIKHSLYIAQGPRPRVLGYGGHQVAVTKKTITSFNDVVVLQTPNHHATVEGFSPILQFLKLINLENGYHTHSKGNSHSR